VQMDDWIQHRVTGPALHALAERSPRPPSR